MVPTKLVNAFIVLLGCIAAVNIGSFLSYNSELGLYLLLIVIPATLFAVTSNFAFLIAFVTWCPFALPVPGMKVPLIIPILALIALVGLLRVCLTQTLRYVPSINWLMLACFAWAPLRFVLKPVTKLGGQIAGGSGVSGLTAYFGFFVTGLLIVMMGTVLNTREKVVQAMIWSGRLCLFWSVLLLGAAFNPSLHTVYLTLGGFPAGYIAGTIYRIILLPGYAYFILGVVLCPNLFRLNRLRRFRCVLYFLLAIFMIVIGGNRSVLISSIVFVSLLLVLQRRFVLGFILCSVLGGVVASSVVTMQNMKSDDIPGYARILGVFSSRIDDSSGGSASAEWRYKVWRSGVDKIMDHPFLGNGYGNLPKRLDLTRGGSTADDTDFEIILAMGEAHNGFVVAAYGLGIPMALGLTLALVWRILTHGRWALRLNPTSELGEFHAFISAYLAGGFVLIYTAFDLSGTSIWVYASLGLLMARLTAAPPMNPAPGLGASSYSSLPPFRTA